MQYSIINYNHHAVHYIPETYLRVFIFKRVKVLLYHSGRQTL